jgi:alcohol dehydrogenase class IV
MTQYQLTIPAFVKAGRGTVQSLSAIIAAESARRVIVFTDAGVLSTGILEPVFEQIKAAGASYEIISDLKPEPSTTDVTAAVARMRSMDGELVIAVGGGSVLDMAKFCAAMKSADYSIYDLLDDPTRMIKGLPTVMIPTTCGTGSEATYNAIVAVPEKELKVGIVNTSMLADYVLLDADMIRYLPPKFIASSGVDALAHVVECYTSNKANPFSNLYALEGAKLIFKSIVSAYQNAEDMSAKTDMLLGAFYGGVAIAASGTTAVHALSYPLGGKFHIPHGVSNAIMLAPVMRANLADCERELAELEDAVNPGGYNRTTLAKAESLIGRIEAIVKATDIPATLETFGVNKGHLDFLVDAAYDVRRLLDNNKRDLSKEVIRQIYMEVL